MRKILAVPLLVVALLAGSSLPADATAPGHFFEVEFGGCDVIAVFDTYGNAFAYMNEFSTSRCGAQSWIQVWGATSAGVGAGPWCKMAYRLGNPYPGLCKYDGLAVTAVVGGTALGLHIRLCAANGICDYERNYNIWDGLP